jgi:site-specific DNA-cytosine methylase
MKILQLCCISNLWCDRHVVTNIDLKNGKNVLDLPDDYGQKFDLVCAAPPCDQFTLASAWMWSSYPEKYIAIAQKCFNICIKSDALWFLENPPGRIEKFLPELTKFRVLTWTGNITNKQYVIYSNFLVLQQPAPRYGKKNIVRSKAAREAWQPDFIENIKNCLAL